MLGGGLCNAGQPSGMRTAMALALAVVACLAASSTLTAARADSAAAHRSAISLAASDSLHRLQDSKPTITAVTILPDSELLDLDSDFLPNEIPRGAATAAAAAVNTVDVITIPPDTIDAALGWPDWRPDRPDADAELLPVRSGDIIGLRAKSLNLFCNVRDLSVNIPSTTTSNNNAAVSAELRSALTCDESSADGPGGSLLVIGANFISDAIEADTGVFYIKSQRTNKFCGVVPAPPLGDVGEDGEEGMEAGKEDLYSLEGDGIERRRRQGGRLAVTCDKAHYDDTCEWVAAVSHTDPRVVFLHPANPSAGGATAATANDRGALFTCAPRGQEGLVVCEEGTNPSGRKAEMEVVNSGYRPGGGDDDGDGGNPYYPGGGDDDGENPYYPGGGDDDGGNPYYPGDGSNLQSTDTLDSGKDRGGGGGDDDGNPYYPGGGGGHSGMGKREKLPFRTGCMVRLVSPHLDTVCDTADSPSPYGPYGLGGGDAAVLPTDCASTASAAAANVLGRRGGVSSGSSRSNFGISANGGSYAFVRHAPYNSYDGGDDDDDVLAFVVWCNASVPDSGSQPWAATATATGDSSSAGGKAQGSKWDLDGYVLMGNDFATADLYDGSRVYLKNQNTHKFCRVTADQVLTEIPTATASDATAAVDDDDLTAPTNDVGRHHGGKGGRGGAAWALVCDRTTSGKETELVLELVEAEEQMEGGDHVEATSAVLESGSQYGDNEYLLDDMDWAPWDEVGDGDGGDDVASYGDRDQDLEDHDGLGRRRHEQDEQDEQDEEDEQGEQDEQDEHDRRRKRHHKRAAVMAASQPASADSAASAVAFTPRRLTDGGTSSISTREEGDNSLQGKGTSGKRSGGDKGGGGYWPPSAGGGGGKKASVLVRLRAPGNGMRYCAPQRSLPGAPITCNLAQPDPRRHGVTTFRLVDAQTSYDGSRDPSATRR